MNLKFVVSKLDDVPEQFRALYVQDGASFRLNVEGAVPKDKLDEFRNNNIELQKQIDAFKGVDPKKHQELLMLQQKLQEKELLEKGEVDKLVQLRTTAMREELEGKLNQATSQLTTANSQLSVLMVDNVVKSAAIKLGVVPTAVDDVMLRARGVFQVEGGNAVPKDAQGQVIYGKDGTTPMSVEEWARGLKTTAPHLFAMSHGSGAGGGNQSGGQLDMSKLTAAQKITMGLNQMAGIPKDLQ